MTGVVVGSWLALRGLPWGTPSGEPTTIPAAGHPAVTGQWVRIAVGPLSPRWEASGVWVDGRFLLVGGHDDFMCPPGAGCVMPDLLTDGALYDPRTDQWTPIAPIPPMPAAVMLGRGVSLGTSAYFGGWRGWDEGQLLRYDTATNEWMRYAVPSPGGQLVVVGDKIVILSGSDGERRFDDLLFDPAAGEFMPLPADPLGPSFDRQAVWLGDRLLLAAKPLASSGASLGGRPLVWLAELDADLSVWRNLGVTELVGWNPVLSGGRVVWPGTNVRQSDGPRGHPPFGRILDPATGAWTDLPASGGLGGLPLAEPNGSGPVLVVADRVSVDGHLLDPVTLAWTDVAQIPRNPVGATLLDSPDAILAWGGGDERTPSADGHLFRVPPA